MIGVLVTVSAWAQDPPIDEGSLFGDSPSTERGPTQGHTERASPDAFASGAAKDNALQLGGTYYQRAVVSGQENVSLSNTPMSLPLQFDSFMDARPNDNVRGFVQARLFFDAGRDSFSRTTNGASSGSLQFASTSTAPTSLGTSTLPNNPQVALNQAWLKFDIDRTVFVTAGKQKVKWGPSRFWNPTDFLNPVKRDPLLPYDLRLGNSMVKFEVPWEAQKANLYFIALLDNPNASSTLGQLGAAIRAEKTIGSTEVGIELLTRGQRTPILGADLSAPLGPFDFYLEGSYLTTAPPLFSLNSPLVTGAEVSNLVSTTTPSGALFQLTGGMNYQFAWQSNRLATIGGEYFYNSIGYSNSNIYPVLIFTGNYLPFYTGVHYAALYLTAEGPDDAKHTSYTFSTLANLSDRSYISRVDFSWRILTYLTFEAYGDIHYGESGGEFNFALSTPALTYLGTALTATQVARTVWDFGLALRVSF